MRRKDVKTIIAYFYGIPAMWQMLADEQAELEDEYNGLRGTSYDGMPHSWPSGRSPGMCGESWRRSPSACTFWRQTGRKFRTA